MSNYLSNLTTEDFEYRRNFEKMAKLKHKSSSLSSSNKIFLKVPYKDKNEVKKNGAFWDSNVKKWYIIDGFENYKQIFKKWL